jgi:hypothetical protein
MSQYRVFFFKDLLNCNGHLFKCLQGQIVVHDSNDTRQAVASASREFEMLNRVSDWKLYADTIEVVADERCEFTT